MLLGAYFTMDKYLMLRKRQTEEKEDISLTEAAFTLELSKLTELENTWLVLFILTVTIFLVSVIILIFLRKRISIAVALIGQASK